MQETISNGYQVMSDGRRVWVNGRKGESIARLADFGELVLIDIHRPLNRQRATGGECLDCRHVRKDEAAWEAFVMSLKHHYAIEVGEEHKPKWARKLESQTAPK